jgi:hypothetical protein
MLEALAIVVPLVTSLLRPAAVQTAVPMAVAQATQGAPAPASISTASLAPDTPDVPWDTGPLRGKIGERMESGGYVLTVLGIYDEPDAELRNILDLKRTSDTSPRRSSWRTELTKAFSTGVGSSG